MFPGRGVTVKRLSNYYYVYRFISFIQRQQANIFGSFSTNKNGRASKTASERLRQMATNARICEECGRLPPLENPKLLDFGKLSLYYEYLRFISFNFLYVPAPTKKMPYVFNQEKGFAI